MKKLDKDESKEHARLASLLEQQGDAVRDAVESFQDEVSSLWQEKVVPLIEAYNGTIEEARDFTSGIVNAIDGYMSERTEEWIEGDRGEAYQAWKDAWEYADLETVDAACPVDSIAVPEVNAGDTLSTLPEWPEP